MQKSASLVIILVVLTAIICPPAMAELCEVKSVLDGDSLMVSCPAYKGVLGLRGIDAPELGQPYGEQAKAQLVELLGTGKVTVSEVIQHEHKGVVFLGDGRNVNVLMIMNGHAWSSNRVDNSANYRLALEKQAKAGKVGMWVAGNHLPPWDYRKSRGLKESEETAYIEAVSAMLANSSAKSSRLDAGSAGDTSESRPAAGSGSDDSIDDVNLLDISAYVTNNTLQVNFLYKDRNTDELVHWRTGSAGTRCNVYENAGNILRPLKGSLITAFNKTVNSFSQDVYADIPASYLNKGKRGIVECQVDTGSKILAATDDFSLDNL